jgi:hypothetical protein
MMSNRFWNNYKTIRAHYMPAREFISIRQPVGSGYQLLQLLCHFCTLVCRMSRFGGALGGPLNHLRYLLNVAAEFGGDCC